MIGCKIRTYCCYLRHTIRRREQKTDDDGGKKSAWKIKVIIALHTHTHIHTIYAAKQSEYTWSFKLKINNLFSCWCYPRFSIALCYGATNWQLVQKGTRAWNVQHRFEFFSFFFSKNLEMNEENVKFLQPNRIKSNRIRLGSVSFMLMNKCSTIWYCRENSFGFGEISSA